jgi:hypothetical protein
MPAKGSSKYHSPSIPRVQNLDQRLLTSQEENSLASCLLIYFGFVLTTLYGRTFSCEVGSLGGARADLNDPSLDQWTLLPGNAFLINKKICKALWIRTCQQLAARPEALPHHRRLSRVAW